METATKDRSRMCCREDCHRRGEKLPDAVLAEFASSAPLRVLEFDGRYDVRRLQQFHDDCQERGLPYETW